MKELKGQFVGALFVVLTVAALVAAGINFRQQFKYLLCTDGITWVDRTSPDGRPYVVALDVKKGSSGERAGIHRWEVLDRIGTVKIRSSSDIPAILFGKPWLTVDYYLYQDNVEVKKPVRIEELGPERTIYYLTAVGLAYLGIGLFVYFRRESAPKARHFFLLCLCSFVYSCFHYTGKLNPFDKVIYWSNVVAGFLAPALFVHFCATFPEVPRRLRGVFRQFLIYVPSLLLIALYVLTAMGVLRYQVSLVEVRWYLDRLWLPFLSGGYLLGAAILGYKQRRVEDSILRQQMKWLRNGAIIGILPFTLFYVIPYSFGVLPSGLMKAAVLSLPLIPLAWAYAILRYRLMDVDVIFQQGYVYTLASLAVLAVIYGLLFSFGRVEELPPAAVVVLILVATFIFQPIRNWLQENLDRYVFYRESYDYRRTLLDFARELSSENDLEESLHGVASRLLNTLNVQHVAFFLSNEDNPLDFELSLVHGSRPSVVPSYPNLGFLREAIGKPYLFFERTKFNPDYVFGEYSHSTRQTISELDLTYYIPCTVRGQTIAFLGVSRTSKGDFLTSDDLELLVTLSNSVGITVDNARLYRSLQRKVEENERLKEFSENIVESINVGILAADLDGSVGSWNSQLERLTGVTREAAIGKRLEQVLPIELVATLAERSNSPGIQHVYKARLARKGKQREVLLNIAIAPLFSKDQTQIGRLIIFDDITDRADLESRLVQADKLSSIGLLAAGVAHEVNTPLAVISTYAQMLSKRMNGDEKTILLDKIAKQTFRASEIVNSLLNFSRTSTLDWSEVSLNRVVRDTASLIEHQLEKARVTVAFQLDESLGQIKGNQGKMQQVFLNLFLNARDAMEGGGVLTIRSYSDGDVAHIEIADTGAGISADHVDRIFDPFFTTKGAKKGTGLGLSISYGIVQEHGGSIEVTSAPNQGTRFRLDFPLVKKTVHV
ncbi:GAF domain-containing sensor histidine kinase [Bryobacter aggregatus]|uniref:GAF domain-containing sensor histidine kinase n=1 Tax=Bryobacter aggregatus TaxID=360054 RepID=UPI000559EF1A|nr:ATP-binding protein [Bryobacter aggregatus]